MRFILYAVAIFGASLIMSRRIRRDVRTGRESRGDAKVQDVSTSVQTGEERSADMDDVSLEDKNVSALVETSEGRGDDEDDVSLTKKALDWIECSSRLLAGVWSDLRTGDPWESDVDLSKVKPTKRTLEERCEEQKTDCADLKEKTALAEALLRTQLGPDVPEEGVRICHPGIAMGYDTVMKNPAWCAYRLNTKEQQDTDNARRGFILDPALKAAKIDQTPSDDYTNSGFDKGHLAPSLAMSFNRKPLMEKKKSPWLSSYYCTNIAPQYAEMNQRAWQTLEGALHNYSAKGGNFQDDHDIYVITGVAYWDRDHTRHWNGANECTLECPCEKCECVTCGEEAITVPTFYWKVACDPDQGSFAIIAENDPESSHLEGGDKGWPPSVFKTYSIADVETFFDTKLNLGEECTSRTQNLVPAWAEKYAQPAGPSETASGEFTMQLLDVGGRRVSYNENMWIQFNMPFGPSADFHDMLVIKPPEPTPEQTTWIADCDSLLVHQLPAVKDCTNSGPDGIQIQFTKPIKGGTFVFKMALKAPSGPLKGTEWIASMQGGNTYTPSLRRDAFELFGGGAGLTRDRVRYLEHQLNDANEEVRLLKARLGEE